MSEKGTSLEKFRAMILAFPEVTEGTAYGTPIFRIKKTLLARLLEDGETIVLKTDFSLRSSLIDGAPDIFYITPHYAAYPLMLINLGNVPADDLQYLVEQAWRFTATKRIVESFEKTKMEKLK